MKYFHGRRYFRMLGVLALAALLLSAGAQAAVPPATVLWTLPDTGPGNDGNYTAVAALGANVYAAASQTNTYGGHEVVVRRLDITNQKVVWEKTFNLGNYGDPNHVYPTSIAVSGSKVYVAGWGVVGGVKSVFVQALDTGGKKGTAIWPAPYLFEAPGIHTFPYDGKPLVAALGSKVVLSFNTFDGTFPTGKLVGLNQKTGVSTWGPIDFADLPARGQVNALAIKGSQFAAAGSTFGGVVNKQFLKLRIFSAVNGGLVKDFNAAGPNPGTSEAYSVAWSGSIIGVAGYMGDGSYKNAYLGMVTVKGKAISDLVELDQLDVTMGGTNDARFQFVAVKGPKLYAAGYGPYSDIPQAAIVAGYDPKADPKRVWLNVFGSYSLACMGMTVAKTGVYVAGIQDTGVPGHREWWARAFNLDLSDKWEDWFLLNSGIYSATAGIAASSKSIVAVGTARDGTAGYYNKVVRAYAP